MSFKNRHIIFFLWAALMCSSAVAQSYTAKAYKALQADNMEDARSYIDSAVNDPQESKSAQTWRFKGYIYKKLENVKSPDVGIREEALEAFNKSNALDAENKYREKNDKSIAGIVNRYYNESVIALQQKDLSTSLQKYKTYKEKYLNFVDPEFDFTKGDIDYFNAYATEYSREMDLQSQKEITTKLDSLIKIYSKVLMLDSNNYNANYNLAIIYYNIGVELVYTLNPELDLEDLVKASKKCVFFFKKSLPFMQKSYDLRPDREEAIEGLYGIHLNLNNEEKAAHYKALLGRD